MISSIENLAWTIIKTIDYDLYKEIQLWEDDDDTVFDDIVALIKRYLDERA